MATSIRKRTAQDLPSCSAIISEVYADSGYPVEGVEDPLALLTNPEPDEAWVAVEDGHVVGHVAVRIVSAQATNAESPSRVAELYKLFVGPKTRGKGLGRLLVEHVMSWASENGFSLQLDVLKKDQGAIKLYQSLHWRMTETGVHRYGMDQEAPSMVFKYP